MQKVRTAVLGLFLVLAGCDAGTWVEFTVPASDFAVSMPKTPEQRKQGTSSDPIYMTVSDNIAYLVSGTTPNHLSGLNGASLPNTLMVLSLPLINQGKLREQHKYQLGEIAVFDFTLDLPSGEIAKSQRTRMLGRRDNTGNIRVYMLATVSRTSNETNPTIEKFFDSFRLIEQPH